ncbi:MAG: alpha/beta fold hydrolase [Chloroflexi bacterium]|nr:alpha/beta fold hydrolase [Chloroflexota bacterium]
MVAEATRTITQAPDLYATINGLKTHYLKVGSGDPILIMHGGSPGAAARVIYGAAIAPLAATGFTVYAPDAPGFGLTDFPTDLSVRYRIEHAKAFATEMGLNHYSVIGNSAGVAPAIWLGLEDPRVANVVVIAGGGIDVPISPEAQASSREHSAFLNAYTPGLENMRTLTHGTLHRDEFVSDELVQLRYEMSIGPNYEARQGRNAASTEALRLLTPDEIKANYRTRTLICWGKDDHGSVIERGYRMFEIIPGAELHAFDNCGHWPMWDQTERWVSVVSGFLKS